MKRLLVIGTAVEVIPNSTLDNLFGIKLVLPGGLASSHAPEPPSPEMRRVLSEVTRFYLAEAKKEGVCPRPDGREEFVRRILVVASNAAEVEDIIALCQTAALYHRCIKRQARAVHHPADAGDRNLAGDHVSPEWNSGMAHRITARVMSTAAVSRRKNYAARRMSSR